MSIVRDEALAEPGLRKIAWARAYMPVLSSIGADFAKRKPFRGVKITTSVHLEAKTACLALTLAEGGAEVHATGCNPLSTQDDVAAGLLSLGVNVYAIHGCSASEYTEHLTAALACKPHLVLDDGGDLTELLHGAAADSAQDLIGMTEETTTGVHRLYARHAAGGLRYPVMAVNDADMKHLFDNRYGTGQSTWEALMHTTNLQVSGKTVVVAGYGWCGRGVAMRAAGLGARVIVTEIDPVKAIEAVNDGHAVMTMDAAAPLGDFFVTVTGCKDVITERHFGLMKDGVILANAGHFDVEVDVAYLRETSTEAIPRRDGIMAYKQSDGRFLNVIAEGRLCNLAAGNGHPVEIMDMSFSVQALALEHMLRHGKSLAPGVYPVPGEIDARVSELKLLSMGMTIDRLTPEQREYMKTL
ncbi:MAG: adenosylhomocysteinase [Oscillospiraceae bacterium]|jgi:adenosylhomocysteinase|nr:adenosylhomocysteinase [Oscillospiraceae bacterium]